MTYTGDMKEKVVPSTSMAGERKRVRFLSFALALLFMLAGAGIGSGLTILHFRSGYYAKLHTPEGVAQMLEAQVAEQFTLTSEERRAISESIRRNIAIMEKSRRAYNDNTKKEIEVWRREVASILGKERTDAWEKEVRRQLAPRILVPHVMDMDAISESGF